MHYVTLSPAEAHAALSTLVWADQVLDQLAPQTRAAVEVRDELLQLRRMIARRFNTAPEETRP